ncbi:MAG TPA: GAF domain-containing protein, partial [Pseudomonadales bacterium]|nr:GAF domain-containing protein [Pseudomonadales bacterium]
MSESQAAPTEIQDVLKMHQANYGIFQARTERDVMKAIEDALRASPFACVYYNVTDVGLELVHATAPQTQAHKLNAPAKIELSAADIARYFSDELMLTRIPSVSFPDALVKIFSDAECAYMAVIPILQDVLTLGVMAVGSLLEKPINNENIDPLIRLGSIIPIALNNVKAARAIQQRLRELEAISETSQGITSASDLNAIFDVVQQQVRATIGETNLTIALYRRETQTIEIPYENGKLTKIEPFPLGEGLISILLRTRQPLMLVEDTERRSRALGAKYVGNPAKSWLGCPLIAGGEAIGAIIIQDTEQEQRFSQDDLRFIIALSAQVSGAIDNIRLLEETRRRALQLQTVAEISREVSSSLIVDNLLREAVNLVRERFNFYHASIFLMDANNEYAVIRESTGNAGMQLKRSGHKLAVGSKSIVGYVTKNREPL